MYRCDEAGGGLPALLPLAAVVLAACAGSSAAGPLQMAVRDDASRNRAQREQPEPHAHSTEMVSEAPAPEQPGQPARTPTFSDEERARVAATQRFVQAAARKHQLDASLINAVIWVESRFTARARGRRGPRGMMQLMPRTARHLARELGRRYEPYSADFNIDAGAFYLSSMIAQFDGDVALGLAAYNAGPGRVRAARAADEPISGQTQSYVRAVLAAEPAFMDQ